MTIKKTTKPFAVIACPKCDAPFRVPLDHPRLRRGGLRGKCTKCDTGFDVIKQLRLELKRQKQPGAPRRPLPSEAEDVVMLSDDDVEEISRTPPRPPPPRPERPRPVSPRDRPGASASQSGVIEVEHDSPQPIIDDVATSISVQPDPAGSNPTMETIGLADAPELEDPPPTDGELPLDDLIPPLPEPFDPAQRRPSPAPIPVAPTKPESRHFGPPGVDVDLPFSTDELPSVEDAEPLGPPLPKRPTVEVTEAGEDEPEAPEAPGAPTPAHFEDDSATISDLEDESLELEVEVRPPDSVPPEPREDADPLHWSWVRASRPAASALLRRAEDEYEALAELLDDVTDAVATSGPPA